MSASSTQQQERPAYTEVAKLSEPEGVVVIFTEKQSGDGRKMHSFAFFKEFAKDAEGGKVTRSHYFTRRHLNGIKRALARVEAELDRLEKGGAR